MQETYTSFWYKIFEHVSPTHPYKPWMTALLFLCCLNVAQVISLHFMWRNYSAFMHWLIDWCVGVGVCWFHWRYREAWHFCEALESTECWQELAVTALLNLDIDFGMNALLCDHLLIDQVVWNGYDIQKGGTIRLW